MAVSKKILSKKLATETNISLKKSENFLNSFIKHIQLNSKKNIVKIHNLGTFLYKATPERVGRNPKTKKLYKIKSFKKLVFKPSNRIKKAIN